MLPIEEPPPGSNTVGVGGPLAFDDGVNVASLVAEGTLSLASGREIRSRSPDELSKEWLHDGHDLDPR
jgi:hypothetical protein